MVKRFLIFATLGILLFSCIKDEPIPELVDDGTVMFVGEDYQPATKTTLNGLQTEWVANTDKVGLFSPQASKTIGGVPGVVNEPLTALSSGARSQFSGSVYWNTGEHTFYSYYPYAAGTPPHTAVPVSLPASQTQSAGNNMNHLSALDFLVAKPHTAKYPGFSGAPATVSLRYNHLFSIIEIQIKKSSSAWSIKTIRVKGTVPMAFGSGTIDLSQSVPGSGVPYVIDGITNTSNSVTLTLTTPFNTTSSFTNTAKAYMVVLPGVHNGGVTIGIEVGGKNYERSKPNVTLERGKKYIIQVDADSLQIPVIKGSDLDPVDVNGVIWSPVNEGYREDLTGGRFFQWHRKYGFDRNYSVMSAAPLWGVDLDQESALDKYKNVFFTSGGGASEWMPAYNAEWNLTEKFNPCPQGWRLPTKAEATALASHGSTAIPLEDAGGVDGLKGRWIGPDHSDPVKRTTNAVFFPASSMQGYSTGAWPTNFSSGYYWLAFYGEASNTYSGQIMTISTTQSSPPNFSVSNKANGLSVRCVKKGNVAEALLSTVKPYEYKHDGAKMGGLIEHQGNFPITERGVFYGLSVHPTVDKVTASTAGVGEFNVTLYRLEPSKTYFVRAYAKNSVGTIFYGDQYKFTTLAKHVADYGGKEVTINGVTWAPWNAGYVEGVYPYGLLYQWGRKYGQIYDESTAPTKATSATTALIANGYNTRNTFYSITTGIGDWNSSPVTTWDMSLYNPCPEGWRVPSKAEFESLLSLGKTYGLGPGNIYGVWIGGDHSSSKIGSLFLPLAGMRRHDFNIEGRGNNGYGIYWTSNVLNSNAEYYFIDSNINAGFSHYQKSWGFSVRCVKN